MTADSKDLELNLSDFKDVSMSTIDIEQKHFSYQSCLGCNSDSRLIKLLFKHGTITISLLFVIYMLSQATTCEDTSMYGPLLTFIIGLGVPT